MKPLLNLSLGIGLSTCLLLLAEKATVFGIDIAAQPESLQDQERFAFHQCNLTDTDAPHQAIEKCIERFGPRIDALLNVADIMDTFQGVDTLTDGMWDKVMAINLTAPVKLMREVIKVMKVQGSGAIANVASRAGFGGGAAGIAYTSSKHGLIGATKATAVRFREQNIRCNAITPGGRWLMLCANTVYRTLRPSTSGRYQHKPLPWTKLKWTRQAGK